MEVIMMSATVALAALGLAFVCTGLMVGTRGAGLSKAVLGSVARELAAHAKVPVLLSGESSGGRTCITS